MANVSFYGGVGRIGSTKLVVSQDGYRAVFDLGLLIGDPHHPLQPAARLDPGRELAARLAFGEAPRIANLYRRDALEGTGLQGGGDGSTALFVSHCHIDHMGLLGWVDPQVPIYAAPETVAMIGALEAAGQGLEGGSPQLTALAEGERVQVGPMSVQRVSVDHDVPGASGFLVSTDDGVLAYSGDVRLHGRHPGRSLRFAELARGAAALVVEGTTLSFDPSTAPVPETAVEEAYDRSLSSTPGLVLQCVYPRDTERVAAFADIAASHGREVLWPEEQAKFLTAYGLAGVRAIDDEALTEAAVSPARYVVQVSTDELGRLLALPLGPGSVCLHANGEPLGPFQQPKWDVLQSWLRHLHVPFVSIGTGGHLTPADLDDFVSLIRPEAVYPVHTDDPYRLAPPPGTRRVLPEYGRTYRVAGGAIVRSHQASLPLAERRPEALGHSSGNPGPLASADDTSGAHPGASRPTVCVDLDSTLADTSQRHHLVLPGDQRDQTDWRAYSLACAGDAPIEGACQLVRLLSAQHRIVVLSRRDEAARELTRQWLARHRVPYDELVLGGVEGVPDDQHEFKVHHLRALIERGENVVLMVDDLPGLDQAVAAAGLQVPVLRVQPPYEARAAGDDVPEHASGARL